MKSMIWGEKGKDGCTGYTGNSERMKEKQGRKTIKKRQEQNGRKNEVVNECSRKGEESLQCGRKKRENGKIGKRGTKNRSKGIAKTSNRKAH